MSKYNEFTRIKVRKNFVKIAAKPKQLTHKEWYLFCLINSHKEDHKEFFIPYHKISEETGYSERSIMRAFKSLENKQWIFPTKKHGRTRSRRINTHYLPASDASDRIFKSFIMIPRRRIRFPRSDFENRDKFGSPTIIVEYLSDLAYYIFCQLYENMYENKDFRLTRSKLAKIYGTSIESVKRALKELRDYDIIKGNGPYFRLNSLAKQYRIKPWMESNGLSEKVPVKSLKKVENGKWKSAI